MEKEMEKEQRRRKIIARGTDRMALITGRINTLDPDPISKCSSFSVNRPDLPPPQHARSSSEPLSSNEQTFFQIGGCDLPTVKAKHDRVEEPSKLKESRSRASEAHKRDQKELAAALTSKASHPSQKLLLSLLGRINAQAINSTLSSSEDTRAVCSALLGVAVVVFQMVYHYSAVKPASLVAFRPLLVVALTDFLIVAARLVPRSRTKKEEEECKYEDEDEGNLDGAVKLLELGLVLHQMIYAIFVDCSFYLVVVILGLSLV